MALQIPASVRSKYIVVEQPDHPSTFDGPDLLISDKKGLLACFFVRTSERNNHRSFFGRVINALIAYPPETVMVLLAEDTRPFQQISADYPLNFFSKVVGTKDLFKPNLLFKEKDSSRKIKDLKEVQHKVFNTQSKVLMNNLSYIQDKGKFNAKLGKFDLGHKTRYFDPLIQKDVSVRANIFHFKGTQVGLKLLHRNASDLKELRPYFEFGANFDFQVDRGVPYIKSISKKILNVDNIPKTKFDPYKPIRVASLFGWYLANADSLEEIHRRINNLNQ